MSRGSYCYFIGRFSHFLPEPMIFHFALDYQAWFSYVVLPPPLPVTASQKLTQGMSEAGKKRADEARWE
jgi:hypothetical protein